MTTKDLNVISKHFTDRGRGLDMQMVKAYLSIWEMGKPVGEEGGGGGVAETFFKTCWHI